MVQVKHCSQVQQKVHGGGCLLQRRVPVLPVSGDAREMLKKKVFFSTSHRKKNEKFFFLYKKKKNSNFLFKIFHSHTFFMPNSTRWYNMPPYIAKIPPDANSARQLHDAFPLPCLGRALLVHHLRQHLVQQAKSLLQNKNIL